MVISSLFIVYCLILLRLPTIPSSSLPAALPVQNRRGKKIRNFDPTISQVPKLGRRPHLYHRTQRVPIHLYQRSMSPHRLCNAAYLSAAITFDQQAQIRRQVSKNDGLDEIYRSRPFPALFTESPPGGWGRTFCRRGEIAEKRPPVGPCVGTRSRPEAGASALKITAVISTPSATALSLRDAASGYRPR